MEAFEAIKTRRSVKKYEARPVEREKLERVLEAGLWAPSGQNLQPVRYVVIEGRELLDDLQAKLVAGARKLMKLRPVLGLFAPQMRGEKGKRLARSIRDNMLYEAPALVLVGADPSASATWEKDTTLAAQNMMLAAHAEGLGTCYIGWTLLANRLGRSDRERFGIPPDFAVHDGVLVGYPADRRGAPPRRAVDEVTTWVGA
jgi:nitroreductase